MLICLRKINLLAILIFVLVLLSGENCVARALPVIKDTDQVIQTSEYDLEIYGVAIPGMTQTSEGAIAARPGQILIIRRLGQIFEFDPVSETLQDTGIVIPTAEFPQRRLGERGLPGVKGAVFNPINHDLYVVSQVVDRDCLFPVIWHLKFDSKNQTLATPKIFWRDQRCIPVPQLSNDLPPLTPLNRYGASNASQAGGRIVFLNSNEILVTFGNFGDDLKVQLPTIYGTTQIINIKSGAFKTFSSGHRNPQGLLKTSDGIFATEHGAEGGDEFNLLKKDKRYGWPFVSLGHPYSDSTGKFSRKGMSLGTSTKGSEAPIFSWVPSIAPTNLIEYKYSGNPAWKNNILVGTLRDLSIRRLTLIKNRVVSDERIQVGFRVRDLTEISNGRLLLLDDIGSVHVVTLVSRQLDVP